MQVARRAAQMSKIGSARVTPVRVAIGGNRVSIVAKPFIAAPSMLHTFREAVVVRAAEAKKQIPTEAVISPDQERTTNPMNIVFVAAEVAPFSKTGGLGDVVGGLPIELVKRGHSVMSISPRYDQYAEAWDTAVTVNIDGEEVRFFHALQKGVHRVFVDHPWFLAKVWGKTESKLYGATSGADYVDNHNRFALFNKAAMEAVRVLPFGPGEDCLFVANDWHSAMIPVLLKDVYQPRGEFKNCKCALTIHNIAFQGRMWEETFNELGLPQSSFEKFKFVDGNSRVYSELDPLNEDQGKDIPTGKLYNKVNWLKAGILSADKVLTVSPNYATEIASSVEKGVELDKYINQVGGVEGIVNGMDDEEWNPASDKFLSLKYNKTNVFAGKAAAKEILQSEMGLEIDPTAPLIGYIGRLEEQKGVDIMLEAIPEIAKSNPKVQIAVLGTGKAIMEKQVAALEKTSKGQVKGVVKFSAPLAHLITAGCDFLLVPSRFEPCGLIQLHAMQYGTVPIVASTGGLVDTVKEGVTGFQMGAFDQDILDPADVEAIATTVSRAVQVYETPLYKQMVSNCISQDLSWAKPAKKWEGVLEELKTGVVSQKKTSVLIPVEAPIPGDKKQSPIKNTPAVALPKGLATASPAKPAAAPAPTTSPTPKAPIANPRAAAPAAAKAAGVASKTATAPPPKPAVAAVPKPAAPTAAAPKAGAAPAKPAAAKAASPDAAPKTPAAASTTKA